MDTKIENEGTISVTEMGAEVDPVWEEVSKSLEVLERANDALRKEDFKLNAVATAHLISVMQMNIILAEGDMFVAFTRIMDTMRDLWPTVKELLTRQTKAALEKRKAYTNRQKKDKVPTEELEKLVVNLETINSAPSVLTVEELTSVIDAQREINEKLKDCPCADDRDTVMRVFLVMAQQLVFFAMNGNVAAARAAFLDQTQLLWPLALENTKSIIDESVEATKETAN